MPPPVFVLSFAGSTVVYAFALGVWFALERWLWAVLTEAGMMALGTVSYMIVTKYAALRRQSETEASDLRR